MHFEKCLSLCCFSLIFIIFAYISTKATEICEVIWIHDEGSEGRWVNLAVAAHNCKEQHPFLPIQRLSGMEKSVSNFRFTFSRRLENIPMWNRKSLSALLKKAKIFGFFQKWVTQDYSVENWFCHILVSA